MSRKNLLHFLFSLAVLALCSHCVVYDDYRNTPSPIERGRYEWLAARYGENVLQEYLNSTPPKQQDYLLFILKADSDGKQCLDPAGQLSPVQGAPAHCVPLWFPEAPSWKDASKKPAGLAISEFSRRDALYYAVVDAAHSKVVAIHKVPWDAQIPPYQEKQSDSRWQEARQARSLQQLRTRARLQESALSPF